MTKQTFPDLKSEVEKVNKSADRESVAKAGKILTEAIKEHPRKEVHQRYGKVVEAVESVREEALGDETALYSTAMAGFIEEAYQPKLLARGVIKEVTLDMSGYDSLKIPKHQLLTASQVNADGTFSGGEESTGYGSKTIDINWYGTYTDVPINLARKSAVDLIADRLAQIGKAISRKVDSDIVTEMEKAGTKGDSEYGDNSNYLYGNDNGGVAQTGDGFDFDSNGYITFDTFINALADHGDLDAETTHVLTNYKTWARLMKDQDMKDALAFGTVSANARDGGVAMLQQFGNIPLMPTSQVSDDTTVLVDSDNCGYFIDASPIENWDGRVSNTIQMEVVGAKAYGVGIVRPESVFVIHEATNQPA